MQRGSQLDKKPRELMFAQQPSSILRHDLFMAQATLTTKSGDMLPSGYSPPSFPHYPIPGGPAAHDP